MVDRNGRSVNDNAPGARRGLSVAAGADFGCWLKLPRRAELRSSPDLQLGLLSLDWPGQRQSVSFSAPSIGGTSAMRSFHWPRLLGLAKEARPTTEFNCGDSGRSGRVDILCWICAFWTTDPCLEPLARSNYVRLGDRVKCRATFRRLLPAKAWLAVAGTDGIFLRSVSNSHARATVGAATRGATRLRTIHAEWIRALT